MSKDYMIRTIAFIDILGFKQLISSEKAKMVADTLDNLHKIATIELERKSIYFNSLEIAYFSDSLVLSCSSEFDYGFIQILVSLQIELMRKGIYIRGCITKGELYHKANYLFGPALVEAYEEETKLAKYPRIILGKSYPLMGTYFCKDYDGLFFIDPFKGLQEKEWYDGADIHLIITEIIEHLDTNIKLHEDNKDVFMKFSWLKQIINEVFYLNEGKFKYWPSIGIYDRCKTLAQLRDTVINE
jgi:hypothetical protein